MGLLDTLTGTTADTAYSLARKLRTGYAGSAFKVRRGSDSTTLDIGYVGTLTDTASLLSFCSGTTGFLDTVYDNTANGYNLIQTTTGLQPQIISAGALLNPIQGYPSATNGKMGNTSIAFPASNSLMNFVAATVVTTPAAVNQRLFSFISSGQTHDYDNTASFLCDANDQTGVTNNISIDRAGNIWSTVAAMTLNALLVVAGRWDGSVESITANGVTRASPPASTGTFGTTGTLSLHHDGWNGAGTGEPWTGYTSELILAAVMSSGDYATAQADMTTFYSPPVISTQSMLSAGMF
jgi:hypothetical protein